MKATVHPAVSASKIRDAYREQMKAHKHRSVGVPPELLRRLIIHRLAKRFKLFESTIAEVTEGL